MDSPPLFGLPAVRIGLIHGILLRQEGELHLNIVMDLVVIFEYDVVVELRVGLVSLDPINLQFMLLVLHVLSTLLVELF